MNILHLSTDEKFVDAAHYQFEKAFPNANTFYILTGRQKRVFTHVKAQKNVFQLKLTSKSIEDIVNMLPRYNCVILHGISPFNCSIFLESKEKEKFVGFLWGAEFYNNQIFNNNEIFGNLTEKIKLKFKNKNQISFKNIIKSYLFPPPVYRTDAIRRAASELQFLATSSYKEMELYKSAGFLNPSCRFFPFYYYPLEFILKGDATVASGRNILIGNSAFLSNNHLEAFNILANVDLADRKIVVPLSYGDKSYAQFIVNEGIKAFGSKFEAQMGFLSLELYNKLLSTCNVAIMPHYRQQALGNIITLLYKGIKVFLSEKNVLLQFFKGLNLHIFSIEKDLENGQTSTMLGSLSKTETQHNRRILIEKFSEETLIKSLRTFVTDNF